MVRPHGSCPTYVLRCHGSCPTHRLQPDRSYPTSVLRPDGSCPTHVLPPHESCPTHMLRRNGSCPAHMLRPDGSCPTHVLWPDGNCPTYVVRPQGILPYLCAQGLRELAYPHAPVPWELSYLCIWTSSVVVHNDKPSSPSSHSDSNRDRPSLLSIRGISNRQTSVSSHGSTLLSAAPTIVSEKVKTYGSAKIGRPFMLYNLLKPEMLRMSK